MSDPFFLSKTVIKDTQHRAQHGVACGVQEEQPVGSNQQALHNHKVGSGVQGGAVLFCFGVFLCGGARTAERRENLENPLRGFVTNDSYLLCS